MGRMGCREGGGGGVLLGVRTPLTPVHEKENMLCVNAHRPEGYNSEMIKYCSKYKGLKLIFK